MAKKTTKKTTKTESIDDSAMRILIACSPDGATEAMDYAAWLSRTTPIQVRTLTTFTRPWPSTSISKLGGKYKKWHQKETDACAVRARNWLEKAGVPREMWDETLSVFEDGPSAAALITKAADEYGADMVILGSDSAAPKGRYMSGSTAEALLHSSPLPLGLVPRAVKLSKRGVTRINYGFVDGEEDNSVLLHAAALAEAWQTPLRIVAFAPDSAEESELLGSLDVEPDIILRWREHILAQLDRAQDLVGTEHPNVDVSTEIGSGRSWGHAMDSVKWKKGDLLYLGSIPLGPLERVFIGSASSKILQNSPVPVVIRPAKGNGERA